MTRTFVFCYLALMALLGLTVLAWKLQLGAVPALMIALAIAVAKASLVGWYFMDLRKGPPLVRVVVAAGAFWLFFFFSLGALDVGWRPSVPAPASGSSRAPVNEAVSESGASHGP